MFEQSKWITGEDHRGWRHPPHAEPTPSPYLIRDFEVKPGIASVTLAVAGLGQAAYYLNGEPLPGVVHPQHQSTYAKSVVYNVFDLTPYVRVGKNRFGAILGHVFLADPEYYFQMSLPRMIAELTLTYVGGEREVIASGTSFLAHPSPTLFSLRRCGERYDARREIPGWSHPDTPVDGWQHAAICASPGGSLRPTVCPPKRVFADIEGREIAPGLFDFGEHLSGWVRLTLEGEYSEEISVYYSEWLTDDGLHISQEGLMPGTHRPMLHRDVYLPKGEAGESFEPLFTYHGFRYVEVTGAERVRVSAKKVHTDLAPLASFSSENETLTAIHRACHRSILACAQGAMLDCPQREQNEWTGDGMLTAEVVAMEFDSYDFYYEWMEKFREEQFPSGQLPAIVPCRSNWPFNFANGLDWSSAIVHIPYYSFKYSGDRRIVDRMWEPMARAMAYFATRSESHLMDFGVGDWVSLSARCPIEITDTCYYRIDALMMAEMAEATGRDATVWHTLADGIRRDFREKYVKDGRLTEPTLTPLLMAVYSSMLEEDEILPHVRHAAAIVEECGDALRCGVHGLRAVFDVFGTYGYNDLLLRVLTNDRAYGYAKAVKDGLLTLPEQFNYRTKECDTGVYASLNHQFTAMVDGWFFRYVAGIRTEGFGWERTVIEPRLLAGLPHFSATVRGITVARDGDRLTVTCPHAFRLILGGVTRSYPAGRYEIPLEECAIAIGGDEGCV